MKYKYVILDFDGTLADTAEGIYHTFTKVLTILGKQVPTTFPPHRASVGVQLPPAGGR